LRRALRCASRLNEPRGGDTAKRVMFSREPQASAHHAGAGGDAAWRAMAHGRDGMRASEDA